MKYAKTLQAALIARLGDKVEFMPGWDKQRRVPWQPNGVPVALMVHHTAGAATESTIPKHPGNQKGANAGVVNFVQNHYEVPAANFTLNRDGTVYVHSAFPVWHAGKGSFKGVKPFDTLGIPKDMGNDYMLGVEVVSKGRKRDFTHAQKVSLGKLANACKDASGWKGFWKRLPNHKTWAPARKVDTRYSLTALRSWATLYR
jgi:N-acetyl-anhydromuramyl-L-alanine amidase AmpD